MKDDYNVVDGFRRRVQVDVQPGLKKPLDIKITKTTAVTFNGVITLAELRAFVSACDASPGSAKVNITKYNGHQLDGSSTTITVNDA